MQTLVGVVFASVNLDFHGLGNDSFLADNPLRYNLEPAGGLLQAKVRLRSSPLWAGLGYVYAETGVSFDAPAETPGLPDYSGTSTVGGVGPSLTFDTRDDLFTATRGTYVDATVGLFYEALGSEDSFQRLQVVAMQFVPLPAGIYTGVRIQAATSSDDTPFYLRPFVMLRGVPVMRYQGEDLAQIEVEVRWQCWKRFSVVGFGGGGAVWSDITYAEQPRTVGAGGAGFRYELARRYGIHVGLDAAFGPDGSAFCIQWGSAWARP